MNVSKAKIGQFRKVVKNYYRTHGRKLPWRTTRNKYHIFVSEIMLQQTQVDRVVPKYKLFLKRFPSWKSLAYAKTSSVLTAWQGLGYNRRALFLKRAGEIMVKKYNGKLPKTIIELRALPGIGPYTAGALITFVHNIPSVFIETNIRRVFIHHFFPHRRTVYDREIVPLIAKVMDAGDIRNWYYALMDYGSMLGKGGVNPNQKSAHYVKQSPFAGSIRELRGLIIRFLIESCKAHVRGLSEAKIVGRFVAPKYRIDRAIAGLLDDGLIKKRGLRLHLVS